MTFKKIIAKPTLIFILTSILLLIGIPYGIYGLTLEGGASLGGALILIADFAEEELKTETFAIKFGTAEKANLFKVYYILLEVCFICS